MRSPQAKDRDNSYDRSAMSQEGVCRTSLAVFHHFLAEPVGCTVSAKCGGILQSAASGPLVHAMLPALRDLRGIYS